MMRIRDGDLLPRGPFELVPSPFWASNGPLRAPLRFDGTQSGLNGPEGGKKDGGREGVRAGDNTGL